MNTGGARWKGLHRICKHKQQESCNWLRWLLQWVGWSNGRGARTELIWADGVSRVQQWKPQENRQKLYRRRELEEEDLNCCRSQTLWDFKITFDALFFSADLGSTNPITTMRQIGSMAGRGNNSQGQQILWLEISEITQQICVVESLRFGNKECQVSCYWSDEIWGFAQFRSKLRTPRKNCKEKSLCQARSKLGRECSPKLMDGR